jgi:hypothetical protein
VIGLLVGAVFFVLGSAAVAIVLVRLARSERTEAGSGGPTGPGPRQDQPDDQP